MLSEPFNILKHLCISPDNGYLFYESDHIATDNLEPISIGSDKIFKFPNELVYYCYFDRGCPFIMYEKKYTREMIKVIMEEHIRYNIKCYKNYNAEGEWSRGKDIRSKYYVNLERKNLIENIVSKIKIHNDITINLLLYGQPGTGKSSFVESFSNIMGCNVSVLPISKDNTMSRSISAISSVSNSIILIPEIDKILDDFGKPIHSETDLYELLDGSNKPNGSVIIITCNDVNKFKRNTVLSRPGRIHFEIEFTQIKLEDIIYIVKKYYPDHTNFDMFNKYIDNISHAEFHTAICQHYIMNKKLDKTFKITSYTQKESDNGLYY